MFPEKRGGGRFGAGSHHRSRRGVKVGKAYYRTLTDPRVWGWGGDGGASERWLRNEVRGKTVSVVRPGGTDGPRKSTASELPWFQILPLFVLFSELVVVGVWGVEPRFERRNKITGINLTNERNTQHQELSAGPDGGTLNERGRVEGNNPSYVAFGSSNTPVQHGRNLTEHRHRHTLSIYTSHKSHICKYRGTRPFFPPPPFFVLQKKKHSRKIVPSPRTYRITHAHPHNVSSCRDVGM